MECEGSHFSTGGHFSPPGLGVMTRFYRRKMTPLVVENEPPVPFLRRKMTGVDFRWGSLFVVTPADAMHFGRLLHAFRTV